MCVGQRRRCVRHKGGGGGGDGGKIPSANTVSVKKAKRLVIHISQCE